MSNLLSSQRKLCEKNLVNKAVTPQRGSGIKRPPPQTGPSALVQALMELTDHISQQGRRSQQSRTGQSWWPTAQRPVQRDQSSLCCWQPGEQGGTFTTHKALSDAQASTYQFKQWLLGRIAQASVTEMLCNNSA